MALDPLWFLIPVIVTVALVHWVGRREQRRVAESPYIGCDKDGRSLQAGSSGYYAVSGDSGYVCSYGGGHGGHGGDCGGGYGGH